MIARAPDARTPASWAAANEVYGAGPGLRAGLETRRIGYVLAVAASHLVTTAGGRLRVDALAAKLPPRAWQRRPAGPAPGGSAGMTGPGSPSSRAIPGTDGC